MSAEYREKLHALRSRIRASEGGPFSIEQELAALLDKGGPDLAADLLLSLSDEAHSGAMFSLVHAAESLDTQPYPLYISAVLSSVPQLFAVAPNWAVNVLRRLMNTNPPLRELVRQLRAAPAPIKETVLKICKLNDAISPDYIPEAIKAEVALAAS